MPDPALTAEPHFYTKMVWIPLALAVPTALITMALTFAIKQAHGFSKRARIEALQREISAVSAFHKYPDQALRLLVITQAKSISALGLMIVAVIVWLVGSSLPPLWAKFALQIGAGAIMGVGGGELTHLKWLARRIEAAIYNADGQLNRLQRHVERLSR